MKVSNDVFGSTLREFLNKEKMDITHVGTSETSSGTAMILVNDQRQNMIIISGGANNTISSVDVKEVEISKGDIVVSAFEHSQVPTIALFEKAKSTGAITILNTAPAIPIDDRLFPLIDYLILNEIELVTYIGKDVSDVSKGVLNISTYANIFNTRYSFSKHIIVTLGDKGVVAIINDDVIEIPARQVTAVDSTASGDCFVGAFAVAISEGKDFKDALVFANIASSISVTREGASSSLPYRNEVDMV